MPFLKRKQTRAKDLLDTKKDIIQKNDDNESTTQKVVRKLAESALTGRNPALAFLPEFIEAQKGYGPNIYEDTSSELRRALGLESDDPTLETLEELLDSENNESEFLTDDDELVEIDNLIDELQDEIDKIAEELEEEIPEEDEVETDESEKDGEKCYSITLPLGDGNSEITFNTCDIIENFDDDNFNEMDQNSDDYRRPPLDSTGDRWCAISKSLEVYSGSAILGTGIEVSSGSEERIYIIDWVALGPSYSQWVNESIENGQLFLSPGGGIYRKGAYRAVRVNAWNPQGDPLGSFQAINDDSINAVTELLPTNTYFYEWRQELVFIYYPLKFGGVAQCISSTSKPSTEDRRKKPQLIRQKKGEDKMDSNCCQATLSLTRKIALNTGAIKNNSEIYPSNVSSVTTDEDYGFPFKVPKSWLEPGKTGDITVYNSKQLLLILGRMLAENYKALGTDELINKGVEYPNNWLAPRAVGSSKAFNYLELFEVLGRQADHLGIHPFEATLADMNPAKPGKQTWGTRTHNATHALKLILESIKETDGDQAAALNLNLRESILLGQLFSMVASMSRTLNSLIHAVGLEVKDETDTIENFPFDYTLGAEAQVSGGKGFEKDAQAKYAAALEKAYQKILSKLAANTEESAEAVLEKFLNSKPQQIIYQELVADKSLLEAIRDGKGQ